MKKIFVTVAEFLENGGELKLGRSIYGVNNYQVGEYDGKSDEEDMIRIRQVNRSFPVFSNMYYVKIPCTPHYQ